VGDVALAVAVALTQAALGVMGIYMAWKPQQKYHWRWIAAFGLISLSGVGFTGWLAKHSAVTQDKSLKDIQRAEIAATNAHNAATTARQETSEARMEARNTAAALRTLIDERAKAEDLAQQKQVRRSARPFNELIISLRLETKSGQKASVYYPAELLNFLADALHQHLIKNEVVREIGGKPAISLQAAELPERFRGKDSPLSGAGLYSIKFFQQAKCSRAIYQRDADLRLEPEANFAKVVLEIGAAIDDQLVTWTYIDGRDALRVDINLRYDITTNDGSITSIDDIPGSTMLLEASDPESIYTPQNLTLTMPGRAEFEVAIGKMTVLRRPPANAGFEDYCYRFPPHQ